MVINLSPGPCPLPMAVWRQYLTTLEPGSQGYELVTHSHFSQVSRVFTEQLAERTLRILDLSDAYQVLFLSGSAREILMRFLAYFRAKRDSICCLGQEYWAMHAKKQALALGYQLADDAPLAHGVLNETIDGIYHAWPNDERLMVDVTSCLFTRELAGPYMMYYASGQKLFSMPGFSLVIIKKDALFEAPHLPVNLRFECYARRQSAVVTLPMHGMVLYHCFLQWLDENGGVMALARQTQQRQAKLYQCLTAASAVLVPESMRSWTAIVFDAPQGLEAAWQDYFAKHDIVGIQGHRVRKGFRIANFPGLSETGWQHLLDILQHLPS